MKAVVLEIRNDLAAVMRSDGQIVKIKNSNYRVGEEINISGRASKKNSRMLSTFKPLLIAASVLLVCFGAGSGAYFIPAGTVSLDVNPSIEYKINMFDRVLSASGVNDDGKNILKSIEKSDVVGKSIETAVENTISEIRTQGYFSEEENYVVVTANASVGRNADDITMSLSDKIDEQGDLKAIAKSVSKDDFEKAHSEGTTPGKIMVVDMLEKAAGEEIDRDEWLHSSVNNIMSEYNKRMGINGPGSESAPAEGTESGTLEREDPENGVRENGKQENGEQGRTPAQNRENESGAEIGNPGNDVNKNSLEPSDENRDNALTAPEGNNPGQDIETPDIEGSNGSAPPSGEAGAPAENVQPGGGNGTEGGVSPGGNSGLPSGAPNEPANGMAPQK